jgi:hypothetical protein
MPERDYSVCDDSDDGKHEPRPAPVNDQADRYTHILTVECAHCGLTTGVPMPEPTDIDWN